MRNTLSNP
jgi:hypothetical protein